MYRRVLKTGCWLALWLTVTPFFEIAFAANGLPSNRVSDIRNTRHNFSAVVTPGLPGGASRVVSANTEQQICVFCHTPHAANTSVVGPLWNRQFSQATYTLYGSSSLDSATNQPGGISKLCLSCHDGTLAIGSVNVLNGTFATSPIAMQGTNQGKMPDGQGATTGFTRNLGTNLTNDHPISLTYNSALAQADGEMRDPASVAHIGNRGGGNYPVVPLENNQVQCNSCHDPHIRSVQNENIKFLRLNRLQQNTPVGNQFNASTDIICLACHDKAGWVGSAHANPSVADEVYTSQAASLREFPQGTQVWESACLACHDTHTVQGARRLTREGTDSTSRPKSGGNPAIEETCYACHSADGATLVNQGSAVFQVPNIKTDFTTMARHMPITSNDQPAGKEVHDIGTTNPDTTGQLGKDFIESPSLMGKGNLTNRHAECTDCHNPHRVAKTRVFNDNNSTAQAAGTHNHSTSHTNLASGVLRGTWGVEPQYSGTAFGTEPSGFTVKRGDPGINASTAVTASYVTREYQVCMKCHSNYAYNTPPNLGTFGGGTPPLTNGMRQYTNQAMEYQSPAAHTGEGTAANSGAHSRFATNNHRAWHPVMAATGRTPTVRGANANNWVTPFNLAVGTQTMYCTDCHGSSTATGTVVPNGGENGSPWGPHGSNDNFLLKGPWSGDRLTGTGEGQTSHLCFKCHAYDQYGNSGPATVQDSGFSLGGGGMGGMGGGMCMGGGGMCMGGGMMGPMNNLHIFHAGAVNNFRCNLCHVAVPHGWKNKNFLVNLNDVGPEVGRAAGTEVRNNTTTGFSVPGDNYAGSPYYNRAVLKVASFATSSNWQPTDCGSAGTGGNGITGVGWMAGNSEACVDVP